MNFSVGFYPVDWYWDEDERPVFTEVDLNEVSVVAFPDNPEAVMQGVEKATDPFDAILASLTRVRLGLDQLKG